VLKGDVGEAGHEGEALEGALELELLLNQLVLKPSHSEADALQSSAMAALQLSSPSNIPGIPTKSRGIPSSASASTLSGCSRANRDANAGEVYCPLERPVFGMSRSLGGFGGGGRVLEYLIRAM
jgi:hypothetical protein